MQNASSRQPNTAPRWVLLTAVGIFGIFLGLGIRQVVAQTFSDPSCTPPGCNKSTPLFLQPENLATVQILRTPLQIGTASASGGVARDLITYGNITLSEPGKVIQTAGTYTGKVIDVLTNASTPAVIVNNQGTGAGIQATATSGNAIYASNAGGNAALFDGPVVVNNTASGLTVNGPLTLAGASGSLTVAQNLTVTGTLMVNGQNVGSVANSVKDQNKGDGVLFRTIDVTGLAGSTSYDVNLASTSYLGAAHSVVSIQAMYDADATNNGAVYNWRPVNDSTITAEYQECNLSGFLGNLHLTYPAAPAAGTAFRILVGYRAVATTCGVAVYSIAATPTGGNAPTTGARTTFTLNTTLSSGSGTMTYMWDFGEDTNNDIDCQSTDPNGTCSGNIGTSPYVTFVSGGTVLNPKFQYPAGAAAGVKQPKLTIQNGAGTGAPATANVSIYRVNMAIAQRAGGSPYQVNVTDTSQGAGGSYTCKVDLRNNGTTEKTITSPTTCSDTATTGGDWDHTTGSYTAKVSIEATGCNYDGNSPNVCDLKIVNYSIAFQCNVGSSQCGTGTLCCATGTSCCTSSYSCKDKFGNYGSNIAGPGCIDTSNCLCNAPPPGGGGPGPV